MIAAVVGLGVHIKGNAPAAVLVRVIRRVVLAPFQVLVYAKLLSVGGRIFPFRRFNCLLLVVLVADTTLVVYYAQALFKAVLAG